MSFSRLTAIGVFGAGVLAGTSYGQIYITSVDGNGEFGRYDIGGGWTKLNAYSTNANFAVSASGEMYAMNAGTQMIQRYVEASDTWENVMAGPGANLNKGNLEITKDDEFIYHGAIDSVVYYTVNGNWTSFDAPFNANALGDYDPTRNLTVIGEFGTPNLHIFDVPVFNHQSTYTDATQGNGEWARACDIHWASGEVYYQWAGLDIRSFNIDTLVGPTTYGGGFGFYDSLTVDQNTGLVYVASLFGDFFEVLDPETGDVTPLPAYGNLGNHSSIAWVGPVGGDCYPDCNGDGALNILDFVCFQGLFQNGDNAADCNGDGALNILDFVCFQGAFQQGC
jgi:hypothetical protein